MAIAITMSCYEFVSDNMKLIIIPEITTIILFATLLTEF